MTVRPFAIDGGGKRVSTLSLTSDSSVAFAEDGVSARYRYARPYIFIMEQLWRVAKPGGDFMGAGRQECAGFTFLISEIERVGNKTFCSRHTDVY